MTSTIDPNIPATDADLLSEPIRNNFLAAYDDINGIQTILSGLGNMSTQSQNNVTITGGAIAGTAINDGTLTNAKLANMAAATVKGSLAGGVPADLTSTQLTTLVNAFTSGAKGLVPASGGGTTTFLRADGTFASTGSGTVTSVGVAGDGFFVTATGSPVTGSGTITLVDADHPALTLMGNPSISIGPPTDIEVGPTLVFNALATNLETAAFTGDITTPPNSFVATISAGVVTKAKMAAGTNNTLLGYSGTGVPSTVTIGSGLTLVGNTLTNTGPGSGDVLGPASSTDNALTRWDGVTGNLIQDSSVILDDSGNITGVTSITATTFSILNSGAIQTATGLSSASIQAYNIDTASYVDVVEILNGDNTDLPHVSLPFVSVLNIIDNGVFQSNGDLTMSFTAGAVTANFGDNSILTLQDGGVIQGGISPADTLEFKAYNTNTLSYDTLITMTAGNPPTLVMTGALVGNASTATALQNARTIGAVSFNGTANIVPQTIQTVDDAADASCFVTFVNASGTQTGGQQPKTNSSLGFNAATGALSATSFVGTVVGAATQITVANEASDATCFPVFVTNATGDLGPKSNTGLTYNSSTNNLGCTTFTGALVGNASTATTAAALTTPRTIGAISFDGSANIVPQTIQTVDDSADASCFLAFLNASGTQTGGQQPKTNTGLTYNASTNNVGATTFTGALSGNATTATTATTANNIATANDAADATSFLAFVNSSGTQSSIAVKTNTGLLYDATTNNVTATTFTGALSGNATTATTATTGTNIATANDAADATCFLAFVNSSGTQSSIAVKTNTGLLYDATTNNITATTFTGTATQIATATETADTSCFPVFVTASGTQTLAAKTNTTLTFNSNTNNLTTTTFTGALVGNASTATTAAALTTPRTIGGVSFDGSANIVPQTIQSINEATDTTCFPLFISNSGSQSLQPLNNTSFTFNSNTAQLGAASLAVTGSSMANNGMFLPAASTLGWAIGGTEEMRLTATALSPAADGGNSLGTTALGWQNLFGNTGFVFNIENSDWVATHTAGILTVGTGDLRVTNAGVNGASVVTVNGTQTLANKTFTAPTLGAASATSITFSSTTGIVGTTTNNNAAAGSVGEYVESVIVTGSQVALTNNTAANVTSISLTAGDWDVRAAFYYDGDATTTLFQAIGSISTTSATTNTSPGRYGLLAPSTTVFGNGSDLSIQIPNYRLSLSGTTTVYMVAQCGFITSTLAAYGIISARRIR